MFRHAITPFSYGSAEAIPVATPVFTYIPASIYQCNISFEAGVSLPVYVIAPMAVCFCTLDLAVEAQILEMGQGFR